MRSAFARCSASFRQNSGVSFVFLPLAIDVPDDNEDAA